MDIRTDIKSEIEALQQQILSIKQRGPFLQNTRVEKTPAGGTASREAKNECKYARLRTGRRNLLENGKKSKYIPVREIDKYLEMCSRGKAISQLEKRLKKQQQQLARLNAVAASFGLS